MYVLRNIEALSCNHGCGGKEISITYSECVCTRRYSVCNAHASRYVVSCDMSGAAIFLHVI